MENKHSRAQKREYEDAQRCARRKERAEAVGVLDDDIAEFFAEMIIYGIKCCNGVRWKASVQNFEHRLFTCTCDTMLRYIGGVWRPGSYDGFDIYERGKYRHIDAAPIADRQLHKVICKHTLIILYKADLIRDNGACLPGRGYDFALKNFEQQLADYHRHYGNAGWHINVDCEKYFPTACHAEIEKRHDKFIFDDKLRGVVNCIASHIGAIETDVGLPLGVELSQIEMGSLASPLDNYAKCQMGLKYYGRYMDDIHILVPPDRDPHEVLDQFIAKAESLHLVINKNKTHIAPLTGKIHFCKATFSYSPTGAVIRHGGRKSFHRAMHKIDVFKRKVDAGEMSIRDAKISIRASIAYFNRYDDHERILQIEQKFYAVFGEPLTPPKHKKK